MKQLKLVFLTLFAFIGLNALSQNFTSFNLYVINNSPCEYTLTGAYYGGGVQGTITFTPQPTGDYYIGIVPAIDSLTLDICAYSAPPCTGVECLTQTLYIGPGGGGQSFTILINNSSDIDGDGIADSDDCNPTDPTIYPNAPELCDSIDNNCDGLIESAPIISMYFIPDSLVSEPSTIYIVCQTTGAVNWVWLFGNGQVFAEPYPTTYFISPGTYSICLSTTSLEGCVSDSCLFLTIDSLNGWSPGGTMTDYTLHIVPEYTINVDELMTNNVKTWPNPVTGVFNINTPSNSGVIKVYAIDGSCVYTNNYFSSTFKMDSDILTEGSYIITLVGDNGMFYTTKIIK